MKILRNALLASFLILVWSFIFSSATASMASAQENEVSQAQPSDAPPPEANPGQAYDKPDAGQPLETPDVSPDAAPEASNNLDQNDSDQNDPPGRVARLQYTTGSVSIQPHGTDDWVQGSVNRPLTIADNVWADKNSRAELNVGTGLIRIGSETSLTLTNVSDNSVQLSLHQGAMNLHVRHLYRGEVYEVDTPNQAFTILKTGDYRFDVDPNADTTLVTVWRGEGESTGQGPSVRIKEHQQARFNGGTSLAHEIHSAPRPDGFDDWCQLRNRRVDDSISARYVSPDVIGSEDLDAYGTWRDTPEYGHVWVPTQVDAGWAPYTNGQWIYESPWGWTWDDYAPWGFAPFHYGRWVSFGGYWGWAPGPYYGGWGRGFYAPALVSWFGGPGWGVGFGFGFGGGYGWCPLGFGEPFRPWYHTGWGYFRGVNVFNTRINNINGFHNGFRNGFRSGFTASGRFHYANLNARGGFTAVSRGTLERGLPVRQNAVRVNANAARNAPALGRPNVSPTMQSRLGQNAGRPAAGAPARAMSRSTVSRMTPPSASRSNSFGSSRAGMNHASGSGSVARPGANFGRLNSGMPSNGSVSSNNARGLNNSMSMSSGRNVPRPPSAGDSMGSQTARTAVNQAPSNRPLGNSSRSNASFGRSVPRPPSGWTPSQNSSNNRGVASQQQSSPRQTSPRQTMGNGSRPTASSGGSRSSVPRPTGRVQPAPRSYSSGGNSGYSSRSYSGNSGRYGSGSQYGGSSYGGSSRYSGSPYGRRSYSAPSYGGRSSYGGSSYGGGSRSASPSGGGRSYGSSRGSSGGGGSSRGSSGGGSRGSGHGGGRR